MDESQSGKSPAYDPDQPSYEEERQRTRTRTRTSGSGTPNLHRRSSETSPQDNRQRSPLTFESENILDDFAFEDDTDLWSDRRSTSQSPQSAGRRSPGKQDKDKGKARARGKERVAMSSGPGGGGTSQSGRDSMSSPRDERRAEPSRTNSATTNTNVSRQGSEGARSQTQGKERSDQRTGSNRSRLVSGVFVRY